MMRATGRSIGWPMMAALVAGALGATPRSAAAQPLEKSVAVRFEAVVGSQPFACGTQYPDIGVTKSTMTVTDFRLFVSGVALVRDDGSVVPVTLAQDGLWQYEDVALLDFEDGTTSCANGTPETRAVVEGRVPAGRYAGLQFIVGLPFEKNHREPTLQPSPLNLTRMFWNWNAGYKFMRIDLKTTGQPQGWEVHLGSTGCTPREGPTTVPVECKAANQVAVRFPSFDADRDVVRLDLQSLLATSNIDVNQADTATGCMSGPTDADCAGLFARLGLPFGDAPARDQEVFSARPGSATSLERPR